MDRDAFFVYLKNLPYYGPRYRRAESKPLAMLERTLERFQAYLARECGLTAFEDCSLAALQGFDFRFEDEDDAHLGFLFGFLQRPDLTAYTNEVSARKYFARKTLAVVVKNLPELKPAVRTLAGLKIRLASELLQAGADPAGRQALAERSGLLPETILRLVHCCDLCRLPYMSGQALRQTLAQGFDTLEKFRRETPESLYAVQRAYFDRTGERTDITPAISAWMLDQACRLPDVVVT